MEETQNQSPGQFTPGVYAWGCANDGVLGIPQITTDQYSPVMLQIPQNKKIVQASTGCSHSVLVTDTGEILTFGFGEAVGRKELQNEIQIVEGFEIKKVAFAAAGNTATFVVTNENSVYSAGQNDFGELGSEDMNTRPTFRPARSIKDLPIVCEIACGSHHAALRTISGDVYTWGQGTYGQIGSGSTEGSLHLNPITRLFGKAVVKVAVGDAHTLALTINGEVYAWGRDKYGQLGCGKSQQNRLSISQVKGLSHVKIVDIGCGSDHSVLLSETGRVYTFGSGQSGQLGHGNLENQSYPTIVDGPLTREVVTQISCGRAHTIVVTNENRVYVWGSNEYGQLCLPPEIKSQSVPTLSDSIKFGTNYFKIISGPSADHVFALVDEKASEFSRPQKLVTKLTEQLYSHNIGENPQFGVLDWEFFEGLVSSARTTGVYDRLIKYVRHIFSHPNVFLSSFVVPNVLLIPESRPTIEYKKLDDVFELLNTCENKVVFGVWIRATEHLFSEMNAQTLSTENQSDILSIILLTLQNRLLSVDESISSTAIIQKISTILSKLPARAFEQYKKHLEEFSSDQFTRQLQAFQWYITKTLISTTQLPFDNYFGAVFSLCRDMHELNQKKSLIAPNIFAIHEITKFFSKYPQMIPEDVNIWKAHPNRFSFSRHHFMMETSLKSDILHIEAKMRMEKEMKDSYILSFFQGRPIPIFLLLEVSRDRIVHDTLSQLMQAHPSELRKQLKVKFRDEEGIDEGGVKREFFQLLVRDLFNPKYGMFTYYEETRVNWFSSFSFETEEFRLVGLVLGLAIYNGVNLDVHFPKVVYKKLMGKPVELNDLLDIDPAMHHGLKSLLEFDGDVEETFCRNFTITTNYFDTNRTIELKADGENIPVTNENRQEYVDLYVKYFLETSIEAQFNPFAQGFRMICDGIALELFRVDELELLICGESELNTKEMEAVTQYEGGYHPTHPTIRQFWNIVHNELSQKQIKKLLFFITGSDRIDVGGFSKMRFIIQKSGPDCDRLPTSHTCFNYLLLPEYSSIDKLRIHLITAIENAEGFGLK